MVRSEFVLCQAGMVAGAGLGLDLALDRHRERARQDKHAVITLLYTEAGPGHPLKEQGQELAVATNRGTDQVIFYQRGSNTSYNFPIELFQTGQVGSPWQQRRDNRPPFFRWT